MSEIIVTLPDGSQRQVTVGSTPLEVARALSPKLAAEAVAARLNGELVDLSEPIRADTALEILTPKDPEALEVYRHSSAHLLAAAVLVGWAIGIAAPLPVGVMVVLFGFIAGGVIINSTRGELPAEGEGRFWPFLAGAAGYALLLMLA